MIPTIVNGQWTYNGTAYATLHDALRAKRTHEATTTGVSAAGQDVATRRTASKRK